MRSKILIFLFYIITLTSCKLLTATDMHKLKRVSSIAISPDGNYVVQAVTSWSNSTGLVTSYLHISSMIHNNTNMSYPIQINSSARYYNPVFSDIYPNYLFFLSDAEGLSQIYTIDFPPKLTSKAIRLSEYEVEIDNLKIVGKTLAFSANVYVDCEDFSCTKKRDDKVKERGQNTYAVYDKLFVRHKDKWLTDKVNHLFTHKMNNMTIPSLSGKAIDLLKGINANSPVPPDGDSSHYDVSPDESQFAFNCHFRTHDEAFNTSWSLYSAKLNDTKPSHLTPHLKARVQNPLFSFSGKKIAYLAMDKPGLESDKLHLEVYDSNLKKFHNLTGFFDRSIENFAWIDENSILFTVIDFGVNKLYRIDVRFPTSSLIELTNNLEDFQNVSFKSIMKVPSSQKFIFSVGSFNRPDYLAVFELTNIKLSFLNEIDLNKDVLSTFDMPKFESFVFIGGHDDIVQGWIMNPINFDSSKQYPLALLIHGGPETAWISSFSFKWNPILWASRGYSVVMINFHGSFGQGQDYINSVRGDMGGVPYDDLMKSLSFLKLKYPWVNTKNACAVGGIFGGYMVNMIQGKTDRFKCLVTHHGDFNEVSMYYSIEELWFPMTDNCPQSAWGCVPWDKKYRDYFIRQSPETYVKNWKTPHLVIHSGRDYSTPITEGLSVFTTLQLKNIASRFLYFTEENDQVNKPENSIKWYDEVLGWLDKYTK